MGLDVQYYGGLKIAVAESPNCVFIYEDGRPDDLVEGQYTYEKDGAFRGGSYGGYSEWRDTLCVMALGITPELLWKNPEKFKGKPFFEIINFSDCEGTIGPKTSAKLYQDFVKFDDKAKKEDSYFYSQYLKWTEAFRVASENGAVIFA